MVFYYDIDIHFWILIGYISIYFGDTRDYLDRRRGQPAAWGGWGGQGSKMF